MTRRREDNPHIGPSFQSFLDEEGIADEVNEAAVKELLAYQLDEARKDMGLTKKAMAARMKTGRPVLDRLLDGTNRSVTLKTLQKAAGVVGKRLRIELIDIAGDEPSRGNSGKGNRRGIGGTPTQ